MKRKKILVSSNPSRNKELGYAGTAVVMNVINDDGQGAEIYYDSTESSDKSVFITNELKAYIYTGDPETEVGSVVAVDASERGVV